MRNDRHMLVSEPSASLWEFSNRLRMQYGPALAGLDDAMLRSLEKLFELPGRTDAADSSEPNGL